MKLIKNAAAFGFCAILGTATAGYAIADNSSTNAVYSSSGATPTPKFISKDDALKLNKNDKHLVVRISSPVSNNQAMALSDAPGDCYFYFNPFSEVLAVALNSQDAIDLAKQSPEVFYAMKGDTLSQDIAVWASQAGYDMEWLSEYDYNIQYTYAFHGPLTSSTGALNSLLETYENSNQEFRAFVTPNHVILIKDRKYEPQIVTAGN